MIQLDMTQSDLARMLDASSQRIANYVHGAREPDLAMLGAIAHVLDTKTDWLLGINAVDAPDISGIVHRLLELEGLPPERVRLIADVVQEALKVLTALPDEGDAHLRSRIAAQAAWQLHGAPKQAR